MTQRVIVVGAGVVGLTCAVRLLEAGHRVDVLARDLPLETTSVVAAALWYPYLAEPRERVVGWGKAAYDAFVGLADEPETGVRLMPGTEVLPASTPDPWWRSAVPDLRRVAPVAGYADAWSFTAPLIDMPVYLRWLRDRVEALGGTVTRMVVRDLPETDDVVVDCPGLGARRLAEDTTIRPVRGQVMLLEGVELDHWWLDESAPTYVVPRLGQVVVGGTEQDGDWTLSPDLETARNILDRATRLVPELARGHVVAHRVGLRPVRPQIRLEPDPGRPRLVHCYGHGGAGVTLSWGCADEVAVLVDELT